VESVLVSARLLDEVGVTLPVDLIFAACACVCSV